MSKVLKAVFGSADKPLKVWWLEIPCYVLEDGTRVLLAKWIQSALWLPTSQSSFFSGFMGRNDLKPFIDAELWKNIFDPIQFKRPGKWGKAAFWFEATILPQICNMILSAREWGWLKLAKYDNIVKQANILIRAFATVGIIALVDEATWYQEIREKDELQKILQAYISSELLPWSLKFPIDFYKEIYRLKWWDFDPKARKKRVIWQYTNKFVYDKLPEWVLEEMKKKTPKSKSWNYLARFHQWMTTDIWNPHLKTQIAIIYRILKMSHDRENFEKNFSQAFPEENKQQESWLEEDT